MADLELPEWKRAPRPEIKDQDVRRADTALRVGMICGLCFGIDVEECQKLAATKDDDFRYMKECEAVLELYYRITGRRPT